MAKERRKMPPDSGKQDPREPMFASGASAEPSHQAMLEYYDSKTVFPIPLEAMREHICKAYGWKQWSEDPWGDLYRFNEWLGTTKDNALAIWAVNDTASGRVYLAYNIVHLVLAQEDYSKWSPDDMLAAIRLGGTNWQLVQAYSGWEEFKYPKEPLPTRFINEEITRVYTKHRFMMYRQMIFSLYLWRFVLKEMVNQMAEHPELEALLEYAVAIDPKWLEAFRSSTAKGQPVPDKNEGLRRLEEALRQRLEWLSYEYREVFPPRSQVNGEDSAVTQSYNEALLGLFEGAEYWATKKHWVPGPEGDEYWEVKDLFIAAGLEGKLIPSLLTIVKHDLINATREEDPQFAKLWQKAQVMYKPKTDEERLKLLERVKNVRDKIQGKEPLNPSDKELFNSLKEELVNAVTPLSLDTEIKNEDGDSYCLGDIIADEQVQGFVETIEEVIDLKKLGYNKDELTPRELLFLDELRDAADKGYKRDSKEGLSLSQYWDKEHNPKLYERKMKMLKRLEDKRNKP